MKILVTAGATREPLDEVRFLSNVSTGATGAALADELARRGHEIGLLRGEAAARPALARDVETFSSASDLFERVARRLADGSVEAVLMAAAVADYRPEYATAGKITSDAEELVVRLVRNPKILPQIKALSPRPVRVVGFKFTVGAGADARREAVARQWSAGGVDATVHNDLHEIRAAALHPFHVWFRLDGAAQRVDGVPALAATLDGWLAARA